MVMHKVEMTAHEVSSHFFPGRSHKDGVSDVSSRPRGGIIRPIMSCVGLQAGSSPRAGPGPLGAY